MQNGPETISNVHMVKYQVVINVIFKTFREIMDLEWVLNMDTYGKFTFEIVKCNINCRMFKFSQYSTVHKRYV